MNAIITLWYQAAGAKYGNMLPHAVYGSLEAVQFVRDGESLGAPRVTDDDFDDLSTDEDDVGEDDIPF